MDDPDRLEAKGLARAKIRAKRRRTQTIRRRTLRGSLALFAVVWAIVFAQLVSGNDPALSQTTRHAVKRAVATAKPQPTPEAEADNEAPIEATPVPEEEFAPEAEPEVLPEEEFVPEPEVEPEVEPEAVSEPEPEPIVTSAS
jgi:outer membrane biosynthesis protein TonB